MRTTAAPVGQEASPDVPGPDCAEDEKGIRVAIAKLHANLGHPSNQALARAVRLTGGSDLAISTALAQCSTCMRLNQPRNPAHMPGALKEARDFGEYVAIGLFSLADCPSNTKQFMNIICMASGFQLVTPVKSKHPMEVWTNFLKH